MRAEDITIIVPTRNEMHNIPAFLGSIPPDIGLIVVAADAVAVGDELGRVLRSHEPDKLAAALGIS